MKTSLCFTLSAIFCLSATLLVGCKEKELPGSIHGSIINKATGEPIKTAGVELLPSGLKEVTGSEGQYEFNEIDPGVYKLHVTKTGYEDLVSSEIIVKSNKATPHNVEIEKLPPSLRIVNDKGEDIDVLDFGAIADDITRSFNIFNDGIESLQWEITTTAKWITEISKKSGEIKAGGTQPIILTIDRELLTSGDNATTVHITSTNGSKELKVTATGENRQLPALNTLEATDVKMTSAIFHGVLTDEGTPSYTERGFVYNLSSMPTIENTISKLTVAVTENTTFQTTATGLEEGKTYYVRAYAVNKVGTAYSSNEVRCTPQKTLPIVKTDAVTNKSIGNSRATLNGTIEDIGEPAYTERGFVYGTNHNPMVEDATKKVVAGSGTGAYTTNLTDLAIDNIYYVRAYATNVAGTSYGDELEMDFHAILPEVTTLTTTNKSIGNGTARFNATITKQGDPSYTERGFVWGEHHEPTIESDKKHIVSGSDLGNFSADISGFEIGKYYYVRAYVKTENNIVYGNEELLDFNAILPKVKTLNVSNIDDGTSALLKAEIESLGDPTYTESGFIYGTMPNPLIEDASVIQEIVGGTGIGTYEKKIENLKVGETYYVRAYLRNESYTAYGDIVSFKAESPYYVILEDIGLMVQKKDLGTGVWNTADAMCKGSTLAGHTDWRLPTIDELMVLYNHRDKVGGNMKLYEYWSGTDCGSGIDPMHQTIVFHRGGDINCIYDNLRYHYTDAPSIRAVRSITE